MVSCMISIGRHSPSITLASALPIIRIILVPSWTRLPARSHRFPSYIRIKGREATVSTPNCHSLRKSWSLRQTDWLGRSMNSPLWSALESYWFSIHLGVGIFNSIQSSHHRLPQKSCIRWLFDLEKKKDSSCIPTNM